MNGFWFKRHWVSHSLLCWDHSISKYSKYRGWEAAPGSSRPAMSLLRCSSVADPGFGQGRGQPAKEGCLGGPLKLWWPPRDLRAIEGHLRLQTLRGPTMSSEGPFGLLRGPLQTLRRSPYELMGSLRRSVNPFRGHQSTCWSLPIIPSGTLRVPSRGAMAPCPPLWICYWCGYDPRLTFALLGGGVFEHPPPCGFSRIARKRRRAAPPGFHLPYPPSFCQLLWKFRSWVMQGQVTRSGQVTNLTKTLQSCPSYSVWGKVMKLWEYDKVIGTYKMYISDFWYRWP